MCTRVSSVNSRWKETSALVAESSRRLSPDFPMSAIIFPTRLLVPFATRFWHLNFRSKVSVRITRVTRFFPSLTFPEHEKARKDRGLRRLESHSLLCVTSIYIPSRLNFSTRTWRRRFDSLASSTLAHLRISRSRVLGSLPKRRVSEFPVGRERARESCDFWVFVLRQVRLDRRE